MLAQGFDDPFGVAVDDQGSIVVSDRKAGTITQIARDGTRSVLVDGLEGPAGIAFDVDGGLLIAEERGRRILKRSLSGSLAVVTSGIVSPRWIIVGAGGAVYVSAKQEVPVVRGRAGLDEEDDDGQGSGRRILEVLPAGGVRTVADRFQGLEGLAWLDGSLYAALRHTTRDRGSDHTWIVRVPIGADGAGGTPAAVMRGRGNRPTGVAVDRLGALFVANRSDDDRDEREGAVLKRITPGQAAPVLTGIRKPQGIAFEPEGHLLVVEGGHHGRLLRLRAPSPPAVTAPAFTNQAPLAVTGETVPGALVRVFPDGDFVHPLASAAADAGTGAFVVFVPLALNADTDVSFVATAVGGLGLTSAPARRTIMHDNLAPIATIHDVPPEVHVRDSLLLRGRGEDDGSGVARLDVALDAAIVASFDNPHPDEPIEREAAIDARAPLAEGPHTVAVTATDRAGNMGSAHRLIVVDRTPPVTAIASGPTGEIADTTVTFIVTGTDVYSPMLDFSWRLDAGAWSPFAPATTIVLSSLTPGTHVFAVRARDLAGNENGLTPAVRVFTVRSLRVRILEPADGAVITTNSAWIRGTVEAGSGEVAVSLMLSPGLGGRLTVPAEGGMFAMDVALDAALTRVTVVAADASGATAEASVSVVVASDGTSAEVLDVWPPGGLAPLTVRVGLQGRGDGPLSIDVDGDGTPEFEGAFDGDEFYATYPVAGAYVPTVRITTPDGSVLTRRGLVEVYDRAVLESRLQAVWKGFKDALRDGNVEAAAAFIAAERRAAWIDYLSSLPAEAFADVDLVFTAIALVEAGYGGAQYEMVAERDGLLFSYAVWFRIDAEGRWRLWRF
ncbi:MAG: hypothetical protein HY824_07415 [Acidobacteria bacterium]|nr:hypothetical protein [Acidobacteriota bacterium]